jgi:hypothetical protein
MSNQSSMPSELYKLFFSRRISRGAALSTMDLGSTLSTRKTQIPLYNYIRLNAKILRLAYKWVENWQSRVILLRVEKLADSVSISRSFPVNSSVAPRRFPIPRSIPIPRSHSPIPHWPVPSFKDSPHLLQRATQLSHMTTLHATVLKQRNFSKLSLLNELNCDNVIASKWLQQHWQRDELLVVWWLCYSCLVL